MKEKIEKIKEFILGTILIIIFGKTFLLYFEKSHIFRKFLIFIVVVLILIIFKENINIFPEVKGWKKFIYFIRKVQSKKLKFKNGKIYYFNKLFTGKTIFYINSNPEIDLDFFKTKWAVDINGFLEEDEMIGKIELFIYNGEVKRRNSYIFKEKNIFKTILFLDNFNNEIEKIYFDKDKKVTSKIFLKDVYTEDGEVVQYKEIWKQGKRKIYINDVLQKKN